MSEIEPGTILNGRWIVGDVTGLAPDPDVACDANPEYGEYPSVDGRTGQCRCVVCPRCSHHTGNAHQGHYWGHCRVTRTVRDGHFCCPDPAFGCSLEAGQ